MKLFKFLFYSLGLLIGSTIAFCSHTDYDTKNYGSTPTVATPVTTLNKETLTPLVQEGKKLFKYNCASCHNRNMIDDLTGPALAGTTQRWQGREDLLYQWIRNSQQLIASGDPYSVEIYNQYNKSVMTAFPNLTDDEIAALLAYIER